MTSIGEQACFTPTQLAKLLGRDRVTIYRMIERGELRSQPTHTGQIITRSEVLRYLGELPEEEPFEAA